MADTTIAAPSTATRSLLLLALTSLLLTLNLALPKLAYQFGFAPLAYLFVASAFTTVLLAIVATRAGQRPSLALNHLRYGLFAGLLTVAAPSGLLFLAIPHVGIGYVTLLGALPPLITYFLATLLGLERFQSLRAFGVVMGMAGIALLGWSKLSLGSVDPFWIILPLFVPVIVAIANLFRVRAWPTGATALQLAPLMLGGATIWLGFALALFDRQALLPAMTVPAQAVLVTQIAIMTALYIMYFVLQRFAGTVYFSQIGSVSAIFGAPLAVLWFGEVLPPAILPAAVLLAIGVACLTMGQRLVQRRV